MKLDLKAIKVISIVRLKDIYHIVYLKNDDKHAMEIIKTGMFVMKLLNHY